MISIDELANRAGQLANVGRWDEAENLWLEVRRREPQHPRALFSLAVHALRRNDASGACELLRTAHAAAPRDLVILMTLCNASQRLGDSLGEREAIDAALAIDAYFLPALLAKGSWFERQGAASAAAATYANALRVAPHDAQWPEQLRPQLAHAREAVTRRNASLHAHLQKRLADLHDQFPVALASRWREAASIMAGLTKPYHAQCNQMHVPRLPAIPFFDRAQFPWVAALEARTDLIRAELEAALADDRDSFGPYIAYRPGDPVNQWRELDHSRRWSAFHLWRGGEPVMQNLDRCPETAAALATVEMADIGGLCPNAMFSALAPRTHIPPHQGETNARLVAHLPLIVPKGCSYRVGFEQRGWKVGEVLIFDDTIEHEARNDGDELRVVLIFDVWNPLLTTAERDMVRAMSTAVREFTSELDGNSPAAGQQAK